MQLTNDKEFLRTPSILVTSDNLHQVTTYLSEAIMFLNETSGLALHLKQLGLSFNAFVTREGEIYINPSFHSIDHGIGRAFEVCMSDPLQKQWNVRRFNSIVAIRYTIEDNKLVKHRERLTGFEARLFQHETEHGKGIIIF